MLQWRICARRCVNKATAIQFLGGGKRKSPIQIHGARDPVNQPYRLFLRFPIGSYPWPASALLKLNIGRSCSQAGWRPSDCSMFCKARLAQSAERKALNLVVVGSRPTVGVSFSRAFFFCTSTNPNVSPHFFICLHGELDAPAEWPSG